VVSFSTKLRSRGAGDRGADFFGTTYKTTTDRVRGSIITPDDAFTIIRADPKKKFSKEAGNIRANMQRNNEVLVNGVIDAADFTRTR